MNRTKNCLTGQINTSLQWPLRHFSSIITDPWFHCLNLRQNSLSDNSSQVTTTLFGHYGYFEDRGHIGIEQGSDWATKIYVMNHC